MDNAVKHQSKRVVEPAHPPASPGRDVLLALATAELPYAIGTTLLGASFVSRRFGVLLSLGALAAIAAIVLGRALRRRLGAAEEPT